MLVAKIKDSRVRARAELWKGFEREEARINKAGKAGPKHKRISEMALLARTEPGLFERFTRLR